MGRYAGNNAVCDLFGLEMLPLSIDWYTTICDLGPWGAVYTEGWDRKLVSEGETAKATKRPLALIAAPLPWRKLWPRRETEPTRSETVEPRNGT